jgi:hypothetical protein
LSAEASMISGSSIAFAVARVFAYASSLSASPGPRTIAVLCSRNVSRSPEYVIDSIDDTCTSFAVSASVITVTSPAPLRRAPRAQSTAAPLRPGDPPITPTWPYVPLCVAASRGALYG